MEAALLSKPTKRVYARMLGVYHRPHDPKRPIACLDETFKQLIGETREPLQPAPRDWDKPGRVGRYDSMHERNGVAGVFMAFEPVAGWRHAGVTSGRTATDFASFVRGLLDGRYRGAEKVVLVMDRLNTHTPAGRRCYCPAPHGVPPHPEARVVADVAEIKLSALARHARPGRRRAGDNHPCLGLGDATERREGQGRRGVHDLRCPNQAPQSLPDRGRMTDY